MKVKWKRWTALLAAALLLLGVCLGLFIGVQAEDGTVKAGDRVTLYDFETEYDRASVDSGYIFGKIARSQEHVTSGERSLYLEISGHSDEDNELHYAGTDHEFWGSNYIGLKTTDERYAAARDISDYDTFTVDFYNASDRDTSVTVFLQTGMDARYSALNGVFVRLGRRVLPKDKKGLLDFDLTNLQYNGLDEVMRIWFFFDNINSGQTPLKLYMDNVAVERRSENFTVALPVSGVENRITGFESELETQMMAALSYGTSYEQMPVTEWNTDEKYVTEGEGSLKVTLSKSNQYCRCASQQWSGSCCLVLPGSLYMNGFNINDMLAATGKTADDYVVKVDVYNASEKAYNITALQIKNQSVKPGEWVTISNSLSKFSFATSGTFNMSLEWSEFRDMEDRVFYIDNIRIEEA